MRPSAPTVERMAAKPSWMWYLVAGAIGLATVGIFVAVIFDGIAGMGDALEQMLAPGEIEVDLHEPGTYTVFHEHESVFEGRYYSSPEIVAGMTVRVRSADGGAAVRVVAATVNSTYTMASRAGVGIFEFDISEPGRYRITAAYANGRATPQVVLAIGHDFMGGLLVTIFGGLGVMLIGLGLTITIAVVTFSKREKAMRANIGGMKS